MTTRTITLHLSALLIFVFQPISVTAQDRNSPDSESLAAFARTTQALNDFNGKHSQIFKGGRVPIHYLEWTEVGKPLVLLHGTYSTAHDFVRFAPKLIEAGYRPISVDWYGHGRTPIPEQAVSAAEFSKDLKLLLDSLAVDKAVLAGHSRGGMLVAKFYELFPDRVAGLVLIDGGSTCIAKYFANLGKKGLSEWMDVGFDDDGKPLAPSFESLEKLFSSTWLRFGKPVDPTEMFDVLSQSAVNKDGRWTRWRQSLREWLQQDNRDNTFNGMLNPADAPRFFASTVLFEPLKAFAELDVPVLILDATGSSEQFRDTTPVEENEKLQELHPSLISHVKVPSGHFVHREKPDEFIRYLGKFRKLIK